VYFPRLAIPIATVLSGVVDFALSFSMLLRMMLYFGIVPTLNLIWLPFFVVLALVTALGVGLWLSALNVEYCDVRYVIPFITFGALARGYHATSVAVEERSTALAVSLLDFGVDHSYNENMKLTLRIHLLPDADQGPILLATMRRFNEAATFAAKVAFDAKVRSQPAIHQRCYREIRERFGLSAQMAVRAIGKVVEALASLRAKGERDTCPEFDPYGAVTYDERILGFKGLDRVSLWTLTGRMILPLTYGEYQAERFDRIKGQCDLVYRGGQFFLYATVDIPEDAPIEVKDFLGVDLGVVNIATDSDGDSFTGETVDKIRKRAGTHHKALQKRGTKSARRRLVRIRKREANFRRNESHRISKALADKAKTLGLGIALEELAGITEDMKRFRQDQRSRMKGWAFFQLRSFVAYKAKREGVPVVFVDPAYTSRTCSACGHCDKGNRKNRNDFVCLHCGFSLPADHNAAINIKTRASFRTPIVGLADTGTRKPVESTYKLRGFSPSSI
jgi:putative transposase